jgi:hypothetical protein
MRSRSGTSTASTRRSRLRAHTSFAALVSALLLIVLVGSAHSASIISVTTTAQDGSGGCSLGEAIVAANTDSNSHAPECVAGSGADTIVMLPPGGTFTMGAPVDDTANYVGATATPMVTSSITIEALGARIQHGGSLVPYRAFAVGESGDLTIREAHIRGFEVWGGDGRLGGGGGLGAGGGIFVHGGALTVERSTFEQNGALGGDGGNLPEAGATAGGGGGGLGGNGGVSESTGNPSLPRHGGGGGGSRADGGNGGLSVGGFGGGRLGTGRLPCGGAGGEQQIVGGAGEGGTCRGGGGGGGTAADTAFDLAAEGGDGHYGGGGGGGGCCAGDGGNGGAIGGGGGASGITLSDEGGGGDGGNGGFGAGGGAGPDEPLSIGGPGQGGTFGGDAGNIHGGGGAGLGGAIFGHEATITVTNSTFVGNYALRGRSGGSGANDGRGAGGAIFLVAGSLTIVHSTISGNGTGENNAAGEGLGGGGVVVYKPTTGASTSLTLRNTIIAGNGPNHECYVRNSPSVAGSGNLIVAGTAPSVSGQTHGPCPGIEQNTDPGLAALALSFPSRTPTMAIVSGPAVDTADSAHALQIDQRGVLRPVGSEDIGAYEAVDPPPVTTIALSPATPNGSNGWYRGAAVGVTITALDNGTVAQTRCSLDQAPAPTAFAGLPDAACALTSVGSDGHHTIYAASSDANGNVEHPLVTSSLKVDRTNPILSPSLSTPATIGQAGVTALPNATDATSGVASSSCGAVDTSTAGPKTVTCTATDNAGNTASADLTYVVEYKILGFFEPVPGSRWKVGSTVPIKVALGDSADQRIADVVGLELASAPCRVKFSASGAQTKAASCMKYDVDKDQFVFTWKLGKNGTGAATINVTVSYPGTSFTSESTMQITITR